MFIDTEAHRVDDGTVETQTFRLAVAAFDAQPRKGSAPKPTAWGRFRSPEELWQWVTDRTIRGRSTILWAHNLAYDLRVSDCFRVLPELGWELSFVRLDKGQAQADWRNNGRSLRMVDSSSWFGASLEKVGALVGVGKADMPRASATDDDWFAYCQRDVTVLREAVLKALRWVEEWDLGNWKPTGAGQGWAAFRHRHLTHPILHHGLDAVAAVEREAAWTGRCEAWRHGDLGVGPWHEVDFVSSYATVARDLDVPVRLLGRCSPSEARRHLDGREGRAALLHCEVATEVPVVPTKGPHGICWPVGRFSSWLWDIEAAEVVNTGGGVKITAAWLYDTAPALRQWAMWVLDLLDADAQTLHPLLRLVVKNWSRSVVGRFGSQWRTWEPFGETHGPDVALSLVSDADSGSTARMMTLGGRVLMEGERTDAPDGAVHVMSYIMAAARCRLLAAMRVVGADHLAYVDTDGLLVDTEGLRRIDAAQVPGLRLKASYGHVEVLGPRQLVLDGKLRAAGIKKGAIRTANGTWEGRVWRSLAGSLSQGELDRVTIADREWVLSGTDNRRAHLDGGRTAPLRFPL